MSTSALSPSLRSTYQALLSEAEGQRYQRFIDVDARDQFLVGRAMLRQVLSRHADVDPRDWVFGVNDYGRPHVVHPVCRGLPQFNLSHSQGLVVLVLSDTVEVGVDVENLRRSLSFSDLAEHCYSVAERQWLSTQPASRRAEAFFDLWTLREAYVKARGVGLSLPFDSFQFTFDQGQATLECLHGCRDTGDRWQFFRLRLTDDHLVVIARAAASAKNNA